jgi:hypothetical protein
MREGIKGSMTQKEYLSRLSSELHFGEERLRVVKELLNASPEMTDSDLDQAWANSRLAWRVWCSLMEAFELPPDSMAKDLTLEQSTACYRLLKSMLTMFDAVLTLTMASNTYDDEGH